MLSFVNHLIPLSHHHFPVPLLPPPPGGFSCFPLFFPLLPLFSPILAILPVFQGSSDEWVSVVAVS